MDGEPTKINFLKKFFNRNKPNSKSELAEVIQDASKRHIIDDDTIEMLTGVFDISRLRIADIMIPRVNMITIDSKCTLAQAIDLIAKYGHSRYPLSIEDKDHIEGIIMAKDLLPYALHQGNKEISLKDLARPAVVVPESKRVNSMLKEFQESRFHMAIVIDEFGGVSGLVTIEDILEVIVGDISDEYDDDDPEDQRNIIKTNNGTYIVRGLTSIEEFNEFFETTLPKVDVDTIAGMVIHVAGHLPIKDEIVKIGKFVFKVVTVTKRQVHLLQVTIDNSVTLEEDE